MHGAVLGPGDVELVGRAAEVDADAIEEFTVIGDMRVAERLVVLVLRRLDVLLADRRGVAADVAVALVARGRCVDERYRIGVLYLDGIAVGSENFS